MAATKNNKVVFGLENSHYAKITFGAGGVPTFATPVALKGSVELALEPETNTIDFAADNDSQYYTVDENNGYSGTLTLANLPYDFRRDILGEDLDDSEGTITEISDAKFSPFALLFQFDGDATKTRHLIYCCNASRAKLGSKTGKDISGVELTFKSKQLIINDRKLIKTQTTSDESTKYADWFKKVYVKGGIPLGG